MQILLELPEHLSVFFIFLHPLGGSVGSYLFFGKCLQLLYGGVND